MTAGVVPIVRRGNRVLSPPGAIVPTARGVMVAWRAVHWPAAISLTVAAGHVQVTAGMVPTVRRGPRVVPSPAAAVPTARRTMVVWRAVHWPAALSLRTAAGLVQVTAGVVPNARMPPPAAAVPTTRRTMVAWRAVHWPAALPLRIAAGLVQVTAGVVPTVRRGPRVPPPAAAVPIARRTMVAWRAVHRPAVLALRIAAGMVQVTAGVVPTVRRGPRVPPSAAAVPTARRTMVTWRAVHRPTVASLAVAAGEMYVMAGVVPTVRRGPRVPPPAAAVPTTRRVMVARRVMHRAAVASLAVAAREMYMMAGVVPAVRRGPRVPPPAAAVPTTRRVMVACRAMHRPAVASLAVAAGEMYVTAGVVPTVRRGPRVLYVPTKSRTMAVFAHAGWVSRTKVVWAVRRTLRRTSNAVHGAGPCRPRARALRSGGG